MSIDYAFIWTAFKLLLNAIPLTLLMTVLPLLFGSLIAIGITYIRLYNIRFLNPIATFFVSFFRSTPAILHIMLIYILSPMLIDYLAKTIGFSVQTNKIPIAAFVIVALSFTASAYIAEALRSGILAVHVGEVEAGYAVGLTFSQTIRRLILPQSFYYALPNFVNLFVGFLHTTAIAAIVAVPEITGRATVVASTNYSFLEAYIAAALIYWGLSILIEWAAHLLERKITAFKGGIS